MSTTAEKPKRHISQLTSEYKIFWQPLFDNMGLANPVFGAKLGYLGKEFGGIEKIPCVRFFPNELSSGHDYYTELFNWDQEFYHEDARVLYKLKHNPNWKEEKDKYVEVVSDKLPTSTFAVRLTDLEIVNKSDLKAAYPVMEKKHTSSMFRSDKDTPLFKQLSDPFDEEPFDEIFSEKEDNHYSSMTMRDLYCMLQNVPMSNKKWLNQLIVKGKEWQQNP